MSIWDYNRDRKGPRACSQDSPYLAVQLWGPQLGSLGSEGATAAASKSWLIQKKGLLVDLKVLKYSQFLTEERQSIHP